MLSLLGTKFGSKRLVQRAVVSVVILATTLFVSEVWGKMVYTIPVLGVLLFLPLASVPLTNRRCGTLIRNRT